MEKIIFDPKKALKDQGRPILTNRLEGRPPWVDVWKNWWGGATIGRPTLSAALEAKKILDKVRFLVNQNSEEVLMELNKFADAIIDFVGMHPLFRHVPPTSPFSIIQTFFLSCAALIAAT